MKASDFSEALDILIDMLAVRLAEKLQAQQKQVAPLINQPSTETPKTPDIPENKPVATATDSATSLPPESASAQQKKPVNLEQLILSLVRAFGRQRVVDMLAQYGAKKASDLSGDNLRGFIAFAEDELRAKGGLNG